MNRIWRGKATPAMTTSQCVAKKKDGQRCGGRAMAGHNKCGPHVDQESKPAEESVKLKKVRANIERILKELRRTNESETRDGA